MKTLAWDTETRGLRWFDPEEQAFLASWADGTSQGEHADLGDTAQVSRFLDVMESADVLIAHNLSFDVHQTRETLGWDALESGAELHDTDLMSRVMFPEGQRVGERGGHGLKNLASTYLDADAQSAEAHIEELAKEMGLKLKGKDATVGAYYDLYRTYPGPLSKYARDDARFTYELFQLFDRRMDDAQRKVYKLEMAVAPVLIRAEARGVAVDQEPVLRLRRQYYEQQAKTYEYLQEVFGEEAIGGKGSEDALEDALLKLGVPLYQRTETGKLSTSRFALQEFTDQFPQIETLFEWRQANKFLSTYIEPMVGRDVVHPSFRQIGAWTGRMSCASPNMQNIPKAAGKEVREMFVPREGYSFVICDYEAIEVRLLAHYLGDPGFRQLIEDGHDPHAWMASQLHGGTMSTYLKGTDGQPVRDKAKNTLFAITYGAGGKRVTDMNDLDPGPWLDEDHPSIVEARAKGRHWPKPGWQYAKGRALAKQIKSALPNYWKLNKRIRAKIEEVGHVNTIYGRVNPVNKDKAYVGLNALIQGSAADLMKLGLVNVDEVVRPLGGTPILVVHDEVVVEVPTEHAEEALELTKKAMVEAHPLNPRLAVEGSVVHDNYARA